MPIKSSTKFTEASIFFSAKGLDRLVRDAASAAKESGRAFEGLQDTFNKDGALVPLLRLGPRNWVGAALSELGVVRRAVEGVQQSLSPKGKEAFTELFGGGKITEEMKNLFGPKEIARMREGHAVMQATRLAGLALGATLAAAALGFAALIAKTVSFGITLETTRATMTTFTKDIETTNLLIDRAFATGLDIPINITHLLEAQQILLAAGASSDWITKNIRGISGAARVAQQPLNEIASIMAELVVKGRVFGEDLRQFRRRRVPIEDAIIANLGLSQQEFSDMLLKGQINAEHVADAMNRITKESDIFSVESGTIAGQWQLLGNQVQQFFKVWVEVAENTGLLSTLQLALMSLRSMVWTAEQLGSALAYIFSFTKIFAEADRRAANATLVRGAEENLDRAKTALAFTEAGGNPKAIKMATKLYLDAQRDFDIATRNAFRLDSGDEPAEIIKLTEAYEKAEASLESFIEKKKRDKKLSLADADVLVGRATQVQNELLRARLDHADAIKRIEKEGAAAPKLLAAARLAEEEAYQAARTKIIVNHQRERAREVERIKKEEQRDAEEAQREVERAVKSLADLAHKQDPFLKILDDAKEFADLMKLAGKNFSQEMRDLATAQKVFELSKTLSDAAEKTDPLGFQSIGTLSQDTQNALRGKEQKEDNWRKDVIKLLDSIDQGNEDLSKAILRDLRGKSK